MELIEKLSNLITNNLKSDNGNKFSEVSLKETDKASLNTYCIEIIGGEEGETSKEEIENYDIRFYISSIKDFKEEAKSIKETVRKVRNIILKNISVLQVINVRYTGWAKNKIENNLIEITISFDFVILKR